MKRLNNKPELKEELSKEDFEFIVRNAARLGIPRYELEPVKDGMKHIDPVEVEFRDGNFFVQGPEKLNKSFVSVDGEYILETKHDNNDRHYYKEDK